jgi:hypothetical protein
VARQLLVDRSRVIGLLPVSPDTAVPPLAIQLGLAICELSGGTCAVVDANLRWPALARALIDQSAAEADDSAYLTRWLHGQLALLAPVHVGAAGAGLVELGRLIRSGRELFPVILADLTGFDVLGEAGGAVELCEGVVLVAPAGQVRESELLRVASELPLAKRIGVLLVGPGAVGSPRGQR